MQILASTPTRSGVVQHMLTDDGQPAIRNAHQGRLIAELTPKEMASELATMPRDRLTEEGRAWLLRVTHSRPTELDPMTRTRNRGLVEIAG